MHRKSFAKTVHNSKGLVVIFEMSKLLDSDSGPLHRQGSDRKTEPKSLRRKGQIAGEFI